MIPGFFRRACPKEVKAGFLAIVEGARDKFGPVDLISRRNDDG